MKSQRSRKGRGLFYHRDSGGEHLQSLMEYVGWTTQAALKHDVKFDGTAERICEMAHSGQPVNGDLFLDYCVTGNTFSRAALDKLRAIIDSDQAVSHLFIAHRDRLSRPDDPIDAMLLEEELREKGITIVYMDSVLHPLKPGQRRDMMDRFASLLEFDKSGRFRADLASKMILSHARLAKQGFSTGGRAPYGFRRWLIDPAGKPVRELGPGEVVRLAGHHVGWQPGPEEEVAIFVRILRLLPTMPALKIAKLFDAEGIPSPDKGRTRKDRGMVHVVSGLWHANTITNIGRKALAIAETAYGQRSMGDQRRHSPEGPRELEDDDRDTDGKPKVIRNPESSIIRAKAHFEPLIGLEQHKELISILDQRGGTQRGKPRSRDPSKNPLGCRIFDIECSSVMYRAPYNGSFRYVCSLYIQSHGQKCSHNHVNGPLASRFALAAVQQQICSPDAKKRLEELLLKRAQAEANSPPETQTLQLRKNHLDQIEKDLKCAGRNLARADDDAQYKAVSEVMKEMQNEKKACEQEIAVLERQSNKCGNYKDEVAMLMKSLDGLQELAADANNLQAIGQLFVRVNLRMFLRFHPVQKTKRIENKLVGGVLTFGEAQPPILSYVGPTTHAALKLPRQNLDAQPAPKDTEPNCSGPEENSLGNVNRGDKI
jgi:DNA invertase Pin-like site-specific DNA recombinase